jgi:hypothetical protein
MNIFALDTDVIACARYHLDKHVVKMILEYSQLLSTAHRILDGQQSATLSKTGRRSTTWRLDDHRESLLYKATHNNHPSAIWARQSSGNYQWLQALLVSLCAEYTYRYGKNHKCERDGLVATLKQLPKNIPVGDLTPVLLAMPDEYKVPDHVESYRNYYRLGKPHIHSWKGKIAGREVPSWI